MLNQVAHYNLIHIYAQSNNVRNKPSIILKSKVINKFLDLRSRSVYMLFSIDLLNRFAKLIGLPMHSVMDRYAPNNKPIKRFSNHNKLFLINVPHELAHCIYSILYAD